jgi:hypothetical protein
MSPHQQSESYASCIPDVLNLATQRLKWTFNAYDDLLQAWCFTDDLDSLEHAGMEAAGILVGRVSRIL